ncbi:MAG: methyltransferase domain-containing protein [Paracoccaceae bacterium]|nr:methyltransferase domain-containing protein [Paracoccaceae bacterium]
MHHESLSHMRRAFRVHARALGPGKVLEVGSKDRKAEYRKLFEKNGWDYTGCDLDAGPNVDLVLQDPFDFPIADDSYDVVISGQMLEHNTMFWLSFIEMSRVLRMGGVMIHVAPSRGFEHRAPQDCWRFYRDGMRALADWSGMELLAASTDWRTSDIDMLAAKKPTIARRIRREALNLDTDWGDTVGVFRKVMETRECAGMDYMRSLTRKIPKAARKTKAVA